MPLSHSLENLSVGAAIWQLHGVDLFLRIMLVQHMLGSCKGSSVVASGMLSGAIPL